MARILVWFPHGIHPPRMGSQVRALELLRALGSTSHEIVLASGWNPPGSGMGWPEAGLRAIRDLGVGSVHVHRSRMDDFMGWVVRKTVGKAWDPPIGSWRYTPPSQVRWFGRLVREVRPDLLLMNYSVSDTLVEAAGFDRKRCALETHDLVLLNKRMQKAVERELPEAPYRPDAVDPSVLSLDWYRKPEFEHADDQETRICARYGLCLSISSREADRLASCGANVEHLPMSMPVGPEGNRWSGAAILAAGPNAFNVQGYLWFTSRVLPSLLEQAPDFELEATGTLSTKIAPVPGVRPMGVVPNLAERYLEAKFAICPVFGGTGQQVKIVEAMAHGLAVVVLADPARESPIVHGENGLVCRDEKEFADACLSLWRDEPLRRRLGSAARETVRRNLSSTSYAERMTAAFRTHFPWLREG